MSAPAGPAEVYRRLLERFGRQGWWPGDSPFEVMVGAILTQSASWANVEMAIAILKAAGALSPSAMRDLDQDDLARLVYSAGYYNAKARKLKALAEYIGRRFDDDLDAMADNAGDSLREELLGVHGVGEETADAILLYALGTPAFVIDAYTRRLLDRLGMAPEGGSYAAYRGVFTGALPADHSVFGEYHALVVRHGREVCAKRPLCAECCLLEVCPTGKDAVGAVGR